MRSHYFMTLSLSVVSGLACNKSNDTAKPSASDGSRSFKSQEVQVLSDVADLSAEAPAIRPELKDLFCIHVYKLPMKSDFSEEFAVLCNNKKPNDLFDKIDRYAGRSQEVKRSIKLSLEHEADGFTKGAFIAVYRVPITPKWVRAANIPSYMVATSVYNYVKLEGTIVSDTSSSLGGDLQFGKWQLKYHSEVQTPNNTSFANDRKTELNSFQVHGGNPDIGIGAEHMIDIPNPDYKYYKTITVTIGNQDGGSTLITIIRLNIRNNGFPELAEKVFSDIATAQATQVHDGIMSEKAAGRLP